MSAQKKQPDLQDTNPICLGSLVDPLILALSAVVVAAQSHGYPHSQLF
jgi:hypothetical protein